MGRYKIRTMQEDIKELKKKMGVKAPAPSAGRPPEKLPVAPKPKKKSKPKIWVPVIIIVLVLLIAGGVYYWWNYMQPKIPAFLVGADEIEIIEPLEINIPADVSDALGEEYTFFTYRSRAGFVVKIINQEVNLGDWEKTMLEDLTPLFLDQELGEPATEKFQDNVYRDVNIRYLNFPDPSLTIDYAVVGDYLVITTSRESMYRVIDKVFR